jgi:hypothetical protein
MAVHIIYLQALHYLKEVSHDCSSQGREGFTNDTNYLASVLQAIDYDELA